VIIARLFGGIGNQLFIYAAARALALRNNMLLALDTESGFKNDRVYRRTCMLHHFAVTYRPASRWDPFVNAEAWSRAARLGGRKLSAALPWRYRFFITEVPSVFEERLLQRRPFRWLHLEGYWQNERYFEDYAQVIKRDLTLVTPVGPRSLELAEAMRSCDSIAVHARRVVYSHVVPVEYYVKSLSEMIPQLNRPHLFCFSDAPEWIRANVKCDIPTTFVTHNLRTNKSHEDIWLMAQCRNHIIANSSFSWWGAWLSGNASKIVFAPDWEHPHPAIAIPPAWRRIRVQPLSPVVG
jgi:hypothetical protein